MRTIPLSGDGCDCLRAIVDDGDYEMLSRHKWVGTEKRDGYVAVRTNIGRRTVYMHQLILGVVDGLITDHINGDPLDNRRGNLRLVTYRDNSWNRTRKQSGTTSRFIGVSWSSDRGAWRAHITKDNKRYYLGAFATEEEAFSAYLTAKSVRDAGGDIASMLTKRPKKYNMARYYQSKTALSALLDRVGERV